MKPPFAWFGGKERIIHALLPHVPPHDAYLEPFFGAGSLFFIMRNCGRCGRIFEKKVRSLEEIGTVLMEMHFCEECEKGTKEVKEEPSIEEKIVRKLCEVLEMLRDYEAGCDYDYD